MPASKSLSPCNHSNLEHCSNPQSPDVINCQLATLTPKGKMLAKVVGIIALSVIAALGAVVFFPKIAAGVAYGALVITYSAISYSLAYIKALEKAEIQINTLREFIVDKNSHTSITMQPQDYEVIQPYVRHYDWRNHNNRFEYPIHTETHYKLTGGTFETWSITPLALEEVCTKTNIDEVREKYNAWLNHLMVLAQHKNKIPEDFIKLVGKICDQSKEEAVYVGKNYTYTYDPKSASIRCVHHDGKESFQLTTSEECLGFVQKEFLTSKFGAAWNFVASIFD